MRRGRPLFDQSKLGTRIGVYLRAWREQQDKTEIPTLLFTAADYQSQTYIHVNLLAYLQALELLHREFFDSHRFPDEKTRRDTLKALRKAIPSSLDEKLRRALSDQLGFIGALTLYDRLQELFRTYQKSVTPLFPRGDDDMILLHTLVIFSHTMELRRASVKSS